MNTYRLHFPDHQQADLLLGPGSSTIGRDPDFERALAVLPAQGPGLFALRIDARGVWLKVHDGTWGVHVNGRPVVSLALLRAGDVLHVEGREMALLREVAETPPPQSGAMASLLPWTLRGLGGGCHGQALVLDADAERLSALRGVEVTHSNGGVQLRAQHGALLINGRECNATWLAAGDQIVVPEGQRFLVEGTAASCTPSTAVPNAAQLPAAVPQQRATPWVLLAAIGIALALLGLFWFGG